jgi:hypothetical protein
MNGNTPYAGLPGSTQAGKRASADVPELTAEQKRRLRADVCRIAALTREFLPDEYVVDGDISNGVGGPQATVAVQPPVGNPISAGFTPDVDEFGDEDLIDPEDQAEVARGLAASAALQVKHAISDSVSQTAR